MNFLFGFFIIGIVAYLFSATFRGLLNAAVLNTGAWILNHLPTVGGVLAVVGILLALPIILGVSWIGLWAAIGSMALAPVAGLAIGILSLVGIFAFRKTIGIILTIAFIAIVIGFCFPILKGAMNRYSESKQTELAIGLDNQTLQMGVSSAVVIENSVLHNNDGTLSGHEARKGDEVQTVSMVKKRFGKSPEIFINVMLKDVNEEFAAGACGWIPVRKLKFGTTAAEEAKRAEKIDADEISRRELEKETAPATSTSQIPSRFELVKEVELKNGGNSEFLTLTPGEYKVSPANSKLKIRGIWGTKEGGVFSLSQESEVVVFPPSGIKKFSVYRKEGG